MKEISITRDIIPVGEFKTGLSKWLKNVQSTGHPIIITQNGRPAGVLVPPEEFDRLWYTKRFVDSVNRGMENAESGKVYSTLQLRQKLEERRQNKAAP